MEFKIAGYVVIIIAIICLLGYILVGSGNKYPYETVISGVKINSYVPLDDVQNFKTLALLNSSGKAATTCNFELSAISNNDKSGYMVMIENGEKGVYVNQKVTSIRGRTDDEILDSCHAFACLRDGIKCPANFADIRETILNSNQMNLILDSRVTGKGIRAYAEILGALGYLQAILVDSDKDEVIEQKELEENGIFIYPYLMEGGNCTLQPFKNIIEVLNVTNETRDCEIEPGIYIQVSDKNEIRIDGEKVILSGDEEHIHTEAIIVRDILSPEWVRVMYGLD